MIFVDNENNTDARVNLAIEEYLLRHVFDGEDILLFYINAPSIIIGRNQNTLAEINHRYVEEHGITVVRRLSGGGAVYHDLGNLNFSFLTRYSPTNFQNFRKFTEPVIRVLRELGVDASLGGRNDILANGRKISGNAQYRSGDRMFSHGTLLFDSHLEHVADALNVKIGKIEAKGIASVRSRVANIREFLPTNDPPDTLAFRQRLLEGIFAGEPSIPQYRLTDADRQAIQDLADARYRSWEWNYGRSLEFNVHRSHRFPIGEIEVCIRTFHGLIQECKIYGDFFGERDVAELEGRLAGVPYSAEGLRDALAGLDPSLYFGAVTRDELIELLY